MPVVTPALALIIFAAGAVAGSLGALLGIGGGVFLVPFLNLALGLPFSAAAAISLATVIATSNTVTAGRTGKQLINFRLAMLLEVATVAGSLLGGLTAVWFPQTILQRLFGVMAAIVAVVMIGRRNLRNVNLDPASATGVLGGRFHEDESGGVVSYSVKRVPVALFASFLAGNLSSLLGIGGGVIKVPALNAWCGVPMRAAAATSAFMIGVTATGGAMFYYARGQLVPPLAAAAILGVQLGSWGGLRFSAWASVKWLKLLLAAILIVVAASMFFQGSW